MPSETLTLSADAGPRRLHEARTHRKVQPVVMIFDSKPRYPRKKHAKKPKTSCTTTSGKAFAFVHTSRPGKADEESRRLVKTHVMQDVLRRKSGGCSKLEVGSPTSLCLCPDSLRSKGGSPQAPPSYLLIFPIQTEPYMLRLVHDYAGAMLPPSSSATDSAWFPLVMTDAALFHALLCVSALFGLHDMILQRKHMIESIRLINNRLPGYGATSDATICAILFMAKAEYFQGNHGAWGVHMDGVKRIVELRGGTVTLSDLIQQKIYSTDLLGCIEIGALPRFPIIDLPKLSSPPYLDNLPPAVVSLAKNYTLDAEFMGLLSEIATHITSSPATDDTPSLQYRLLSLCNTRPYQHSHGDCLILTKTFRNHAQQAKSEIIQELLLISTLLFLSLPHLCAVPPIRPVNYTYLLSRLDSSAGLILVDHDTLLQQPEFLLWLLFLGDVLFSTPVSLSAGTWERSPFRGPMIAVSAILNITSWDEMKVAMGMMWAIDPKYEKPYRRLWEDAVVGHAICYEK